MTFWSPVSAAGRPILPEKISDKQKRASGRETLFFQKQNREKMASIFGHAMLPFTGGKLLNYSPKLLIFGILASVIPDLDVIGFKLGIPYEHWLGHRGLSHSFLFSALFAGFLVYLFFRKESNRPAVFFYLFLSGISHGILDAFTTGGEGVGFFIPFDTGRYFFPWQFIQVSPIGIREFLSGKGAEVLLSEFIYIFLPCFILLIINWLRMKIKAKKA